MIVDLILTILQNIVNLLLSPLTALNIAIDFVSNISIVTQFLSVIAYVLPWNNILPLILIISAVFVFRIAISIIKTVWQLLPIL